MVIQSSSPKNSIFFRFYCPKSSNVILQMFQELIRLIPSYCFLQTFIFVLSNSNKKPLTYFHSYVLVICEFLSHAFYYWYLYVY